MRSFMIAAGVALVHIFTGAAILGSGQFEAVVKITPVATMTYLLGDPVLVAASLIVVGVLALIPFCRASTCITGFRLLVAPQQVLLLMHAISVIWAISVGHYPDGYTPMGGAYFIFADQAWLLMVVLLHTLEYCHEQDEEF